MHLFFNSAPAKHPILFEVFTNSKDESDALYIMYHLESSVSGGAKKIIKSVIGEKGVENIKRILKK